MDTILHIPLAIGTFAFGQHIRYTTNLSFRIFFRYLNGKLLSHLINISNKFEIQMKEAKLFQFRFSHNLLFHSNEVTFRNILICICF